MRLNVFLKSNTVICVHLICARYVRKLDLSFKIEILNTLLRVRVNDDEAYTIGTIKPEGAHPQKNTLYAHYNSGSKV